MSQPELRGAREVRKRAHACTRCPLASASRASATSSWSQPPQQRSAALVERVWMREAPLVRWDGNHGAAEAVVPSADAAPPPPHSPHPAADLGSAWLGPRSSVLRCGAHVVVKLLAVLLLPSLLSSVTGSSRSRLVTRLQFQLTPQVLECVHASPRFRCFMKPIFQMKGSESG